MAWESHEAAIREIERIVKKEKIDCDFERLEGQLEFLEHQKKQMQKELEVLERLAPGHATAVGLTIHFADQAQFHPLKYLKSLHEILEKKGVRFYSAQVQKFQEKKGVTLTTNKKNYLWARNCVVATHSPVVNRYKLHTKIYPYRSYVVAAKVPKGSVPYALFWDNLEAYHYVRVQKESHFDVLILGGEDHKTGQEENTEGRFRALEKWALKRYPQINKIDWRWSGQVMETMDGLAFIGKNPGNDHIYVATGFSGNGMTYGTISALLIRDLILGKKNDWVKVYEPSRKKLNVTYIKENLNVACRYAEHLSLGKKSLKRLKENEGVVLQQGRDKIAVYKDELGKVHGCSAVCTHLGCLVHWNSSEKCWDCPCHGSQFTPLGKVQHGPAVTPLKKLKLKVD